MTGPAGAPAARDRKRAAELTRRFTGWKLWSTPNDDGMRCATRWARKPPPGDDGTWAKTLIEGTWDDLEAKLAEQQAHDQELAAQPAGAPTRHETATPDSEPATLARPGDTTGPTPKPRGEGSAA